MNCRTFIEFMLEYFADALSPEERAAFEAHLGECPECVAYLQQYEQTVKLGKAACCHEDEPIPEDLVRAILAARPPGDDRGPRK